MRPGQVVFMTLIICSALVTGATIGVASNFEYIAAHMKQPVQETAAAPAEDSPPAPAEVSPPAPAQEPTEPADADAVTVASYDSVSRSSNQLMVITAQEKLEITSMLYDLGMSEQENETDFIREFQRSHALDPTGTLDSQTLNTMIKQATIIKASRSTSVH